MPNCCPGVSSGKENFQPSIETLKGICPVWCPMQLLYAAVFVFLLSLSAAAALCVEETHTMVSHDTRTLLSCTRLTHLMLPEPSASKCSNTFFSSSSVQPMWASRMHT